MIVQFNFNYFVINVLTVNQGTTKIFLTSFKKMCVILDEVIMLE